MRVLVACEYSARVRDSFRALGHDAWSVDILPTEGDPEFHIIGDALKVLPLGWDMLIAFPPCTHLSKAGAQLWKKKQASGVQQEAIGFARTLWEADIPRICLENPIGILSRSIRKPDQIVHPYMFGEPYMKATCLWLKGLPPLLPDGEVVPDAYWVDSSNPGPLRRGTRDPRERSRTFLGIAAAMATQWGLLQ